MKFTELKNSISGGAKSVYLLQGDDAYFRKSGEELIKSAFLEYPELNYAAYDGASMKGGALSEMVNALKNYPFMSRKRIIKVTEFYPTESDYSRYLEPLFSDFPETSVLIIVNTGAGKGVDLKRKSAVTYVDCDRADAETVAKWIYITLKRAGVVCPAGTCRDIAEWCLCDMARVSVETRKLIDYKGGGELTRDEAEELVYKDADYRIYEMTNCVAYKNFSKFCVICDDVLKKGGDEISVLNGLFSYLRNLLTVMTARAGDGELAKLLKMKEYGVKKSREQAYLIGEERLCRLISLIYSAISDVKSGQTSAKCALSVVQSAIFFSDK